MSIKSIYDDFLVMLEIIKMVAFDEAVLKFKKEQIEEQQLIKLYYMHILDIISQRKFTL